MNRLYLLLLLCCWLGSIVCPPVGGANKEQAKAEKEAEKEPKRELSEHEKQDQEYYRYLTEVVGALEKDEEFTKHMANVSEEDVKSGAVAHVLKKVKKEVRDKLDQIKRKEVERTLELVRAQKKHVLADTEGDSSHRIKSWHPIHDMNQDTFEVEDIKKLLKKHHDMMDETDRQRKEDFKDYEMDKEHKRRVKMKNMTAEERKKEEEHYKEEVEAKRKHPKMHEPGHLEEQKEVWEKEDGLDPDSYDPKTFFKLHDKNGDGFLDNFELETFFLTDLDKVYNESDPNTDPRERKEEMERMREHVMKEMDKDEDGLISQDEFMTESETESFKEDDEYKPLVDEDQYTDDDLAEFEKEYYDEDEDDEEDGEHHDYDLNEKDDPDHKETATDEHPAAGDHAAAGDAAADAAHADAKAAEGHKDTADHKVEPAVAA